MGTPHLLCIWHEGKFVFAQFGKYDGFPEGQGCMILEYFRSDPLFVSKLTAGLDHVHELSDVEVRDLKKQLDARALELEAGGKELDKVFEDEALYGACEKRHLTRVNRPMTVAVMERVPSLCQYTGARILGTIAKASEDNKVDTLLCLEYAIDTEASFGNCGWAYVIDLDHELFEIFTSAAFSEEKTPGHRFENVGDADALVPVLAVSYSFDEMRTYTREDFIKRFNYVADNDFFREKGVVQKKAGPFGRRRPTEGEVFAGIWI